MRGSIGISTRREKKSQNVNDSNVHHVFVICAHVTFYIAFDVCHWSVSLPPVHCTYMKFALMAFFVHAIAQVHLHLMQS